MIHFATHAGPAGVQLSDGVIMDADAIATVARLRETGGVVYNTCEAACLANHNVRHGLTWALSADGEQLDDSAWRMVAAFYGAMRNGHSGDFVGAYILADSSDGMYGLRVNPLYLRDLQRTASVAAALPHGGLALSRRDLALWGAIALVASSSLTAAAVLAAMSLSGGF